jgi:hypothetical protein
VKNCRKKGKAGTDSGVRFRWPIVFLPKSFPLRNSSSSNDCSKLGSDLGVGRTLLGNEAKNRVRGRSGVLGFSPGKWICSCHLRLKSMPLLVLPHPYRRLRCVDNASSGSRMQPCKFIPVATMVAKFAVRLKDRLAALQALRHKRGSTPHTKAMELSGERVLTTLGTHSVFVGGHCGRTTF